MHLNFCTLFDSNYIDKGLIMYESLERNTDDYTLYIFAFDEITYSYISLLKLPNVVVISEEKILNNKLSLLKKRRTRAEYCWTCTPIVIEYVLVNLGCDNCTYLDSDIYFFDNPRILINEMLNNKKEVLITPHWFMDGLETYLIEKIYGRYCVQFNTFLSTSESKKVLAWWREKCEEECTVKSKWKTFGDQKYQNHFNEISPKVHELEYRGGMAPWNIGRYRLKDSMTNKVVVEDIKSKKEYSVIFYHFQGLKKVKDHLYDVAVHIWQGEKTDDNLIALLYSTYITELEGMKHKLSDNGVVNISEENKNVQIEKAKQAKPFECGFFKQIIVYIAETLGYKRRRKYRHLDIMQF